MRAVNAVYTFTIPTNTDWQIAAVPLPVTEGYILACTYRLDAGGTGGDLELRVYDVAGDPSEQTNATINALPDEWLAYNETGIALTASATVGVDTNVYGSAGEAAAFHGRNKASTDGSGQATIQPPSPFVCVRGDGVLAGTVVVSIRYMATTR